MTAPLDEKGLRSPNDVTRWNDEAEQMAFDSLRARLGLPAIDRHLCGHAEVQSYTGAVNLVAPPHMVDANPRGICVDVCLALEITKLWAEGITTTGCCCGHGSHPAYIGVTEADISRMKALNYVVAPNPMRPGDEDSFVPKTVFAASPSPSMEMEVVATELKMTPIADGMPIRDELRGEQTILTYCEQVGTWDIAFMEAGWDDFDSGFALGVTHWLDITSMWPGVIAQIAQFAKDDAAQVLRLTEENEALRKERTSLIETKREQIERMAAEAQGEAWSRIAAEARIKALEEAQEPALEHIEGLLELLKVIKDHWIDYDHVFSIAVHEAEDFLARTALKENAL